MLDTLKEKSLVVVKNVTNLKHALVVAAYGAATAAHAQQQGQATAAATKLGTTLSAVLGVMPIVARIAGLIIIIGGLWALYTHYKSQGREGSIAAGIAGIGVGVALFFLGGLLRFGADVVGIDQNAMPQ